jgi:hypothetical protein
MTKWYIYRKRGVLALSGDNICTRSGCGLIVLLGGGDPGTNVSDLTYYSSHYFDFSNVTIYDPHIDVWYAQTATGDIPGLRDSFCLVTIPGDNGTYEM